MSMKRTPDQRGALARKPSGGFPVPVPTPARLAAGEGWRGRRLPIFFALAGTFILHAGAVILAPEELPRMARAEATEEERLELFLVEPERERQPDEFILTNPDVVANPPDETVFFSDRDQQAAQEEESEDGDPSLPDIEGEEPEPTQTLVRSEETLHFPLEEMLEMFGEDGEAVFYEPLPRRLVPGFEPSEAEEGLGVPVTPEMEQEPEESPVFGVDLGAGEIEREEEVREPKETVEAEGETGLDREARLMPRPRPRLPQTSQGPTGTRRGSAPNVGQVAVDANFSEYGDYLARMLEAIVRKWHSLAWESLPSGEVGTVVSISFRIDSEGAIHGLEVLGSTASLTATLICQDAISSRQPYGKWTSDMREVLGDEQTIRIRFLYR